MAQQQQPLSRRPIVIEAGGQKLGIAVPAPEGYRFVAVKLPVFAIDGEIFPTIRAAEEAAARAAGLPKAA